MARWNMTTYNINVMQAKAQLCINDMTSNLKFAGNNLLEKPTCGDVL